MVKPPKRKGLRGLKNVASGGQKLKFPSDAVSVGPISPPPERGLFVGPISPPPERFSRLLIEQGVKLMGGGRHRSRR